MKIKLKTMQISFLLCHKFSFYHTSIPISKVEIWSPFPVMYVGRYSHTCILSVNLHREFTTIVAKPCSCCFPTYFSCYCNYETSRYICIPKDQNSAACAAFPGLQPSFSITSCDGVNRIRAEKKLKAGNWSSSSIDFKDENLSLKLLINRLKPVAARWHDFGIQLGVNPDRLSELQCHTRDVKRYLSDMLMQWLVNHEPAPTVDDLLDALRSPDIMEIRLAAQLKKKYKG